MEKLLLQIRCKKARPYIAEEIRGHIESQIEDNIADGMSYEEFAKENIFGLGEKNVAYQQYFIGQSYLNPLTKERVGTANVTFEPGCRNNWHIHHASKGGGQLLICTAGEGWYQEESKRAVSLTPGMVVTIPAGVKHWHGAKANSWFSHIAVEVPCENTRNEWCEPVSDEVYTALG